MLDVAQGLNHLSTSNQNHGAAVGSPSREYIYSGGALLAKIDASGTKYFHQDHLSNRLVTSSTGATLEQLGHYPFGESWYNSSGDKLTFTTYERDPESGNDFAMARYYINRLGRFSSPDPLSGSIADPQSLNRYAYTENNPILFVDPSGMELTASCGDYYSCGGGGGGAGGLSSDPAPTSTPPTIECDSNGNCIIRVTVNEKGDPPLPPLTNPGYTDPSQGGGDLIGGDQFGYLTWGGFGIGGAPNSMKDCFGTAHIIGVGKAGNGKYGQTTIGSLAVIPSQFFGNNGTTLADYTKYGAALRPYAGQISVTVFSPVPGPLQNPPTTTFGPITDVINRSGAAIQVAKFPDALVLETNGFYPRNGALSAYIVVHVPSALDCPKGTAGKK